MTSRERVLTALARRPTDPPGVYRAAVYGDTTGELWHEGRFQLSGGARELRLESRDLLTGWDGSTFHLRDGRRLDALDLPED